MDLDTLRLFADAARGGSFAAAARLHHLDPSSVSRGVAQLEARLGVRLFQRSTRRLALTQAGERFLARAEPLLADLQQAVEEAGASAAEPAGTLRMTTSVTFGHLCLMPLLPAFRRRYPRIALDCVFTDATLDLLEQRIDLAVRLAPAVAGDLVVTKLMDTHYRVVASPDYLRGAPPAVQPADLAAHACLLFPFRGFATAWRFRHPDGSLQQVPVRGDITLSTAEALRDAALMGLGPALLADWLVDGLLAEGRLVALFPQWAATATSFDTAAWLAYPSRSHLPHKVRAMIDFLKQSLSKQ